MISRGARCVVAVCAVWGATFSCRSVYEAPATSCRGRCTGAIDAGDPGSMSPQTGGPDGSTSCHLECANGPDHVVFSCDGETIDDLHCATTQVAIGSATSISVACVAGPYELTCSAVQCGGDAGEPSGTIECSGEGAHCTGTWGLGGESCGVVPAEAGPSDLSSNDDWAAMIRDLVEARRNELGCNTAAALGAFVGEAATTLATRWHADGIVPSQDNATLVEAGVLGRTRWFAVNVVDSSAFAESGALAADVKSVVDPELPCSPTSLGIAVAGDPGTSRTAVIVLSHCQDCADACRKDCSDGGSDAG